MILSQDNEYAALLDACVLVPMCLCDTLLRLAENPSMYRPLWSSEYSKRLVTRSKAKLKFLHNNVPDSIRYSLPVG